MNEIVFRNANVVLPGTELQNRDVAVANGKISELSCNLSGETEVDLAGAWLLPGYIDIHNHGAMGCDVSDSSAEDLLTIGRYLLSNGVTGWMPTLVPDSDLNYSNAVRAIDEVMRVKTGPPGARALGVHYEGVFANRKMCGALRKEYFREFESGSEIEELPKLKRGIHMMTVAPEIQNGAELISRLAADNWVVSIGHTDSDPRTLDLAFKNGARHMTHFFNAMSGIHHRNQGVAGWGLINDDVTFDIIADGHHVDSQLIKLAVKSKSPGRVSLISDSIAPTGLGNGIFEVWNQKISVTDGKSENAAGNIFGSVITMNDAAKKMLSLGFSRSDVSVMASLNPAKVLGIESIYGSIEIGKAADLVAVDKDHNVLLVMVNGIIAAQGKGF